MESDAPSRDRAHGLLERIEHAFEELLAWGSEHWQWLLAALIGLLVLGGIVAGAYEWSQSKRAEAFTALGAVERKLSEALPQDMWSGGAAEPANPELAEKARTEALAGFEDLQQEHGSSHVGFLAGLRAAEVEVDLGKLEAADQRLQALVPSAPDDTLRATAFRLHGYVLEELDRPLDAAELYMKAGATSEYPARADAYWQAGTTFERLGEVERAIAAYDAIVSVSPEYAEGNRVQDRLIQLRARAESGTQGTATAPAARDEAAFESTPNGVEGEDSGAAPSAGAADAEPAPEPETATPAPQSTP